VNILEEKLLSAKKVAITGHVNPDGDCIGSVLAIYNYISTVYPEIKLSAYLEEFSDKFMFLKNSENIKQSVEEDEEFDLLICVDSADIQRLGFSEVLLQKSKESINIDHHVTNTKFTDETCLEADASSTAEVIYTLLNKEKIDKAVAECLYTGMVHDTGVFRYSCTSPKTMRVAADLMEKGIDYTTIVDESFYEKSYLQNQILGRTLLESILILDGKCIFSYVNRKMMNFYEVTKKDLDGIIEQLRQTRGVEVAIFLYEVETQKYKVSLRSKTKVDVSKIAAFFGGGGHVRAAGCTMDGTVHDIVNNISMHIEQALLKG
jgi:exopolyphosphatase-related proteins